MTKTKMTKTRQAWAASMALRGESNNTIKANIQSNSGFLDKKKKKRKRKMKKSKKKKRRSVPSMIDGLKRGQRKILFSAFKKKFTKEAIVSEFGYYVREISAYKKSKKILHRTIRGMAENFVGSNNINLLQPNGRFGSRMLKGKGHAKARYLYTQLSPITRFLFREEDDILLDYLNEDGRSIQPTWFIPIIPLVLVNGNKGINSFIPNYNPRDIIANLRHLLNSEDMVPMDPWYRGFKGTIEKTPNEVAGTTYTVSGIIEQINETTLKITELPIGHWIADYWYFLKSNLTGKHEDSFIEDVEEHLDDNPVHFEVIISKENLAKAMSEGLLKKFHLTTSINTSNMHLLDRTGVIRKYDNPEQILEDFFHVRMEFYEKRKKALDENRKLDLARVINRMRFICEVLRGDIDIVNRKREEFLLELKERGYTPLPMETEGSPDAVDTNGDEYDNFIYYFSVKNLEKLRDKRDKLIEMIEEDREATPKDLWIRDLDALEAMLNEQDDDAI